MEMDTAKCLQIAQQLIKYVQNKGGSEVGLCIINAKSQIQLYMAMPGCGITSPLFPVNLAKTALFMSGYSGREDNPTPMPTTYAPVFYDREPGGVALMRGKGEVVGAIGVYGRKEGEVPNNHELAFWCSKFFSECHAVRCLEDYQKLYNNHLLSKETAPVALSQLA